MNNRQDPELRDIIEGFQIMGSDSGGLINPNELKEIMEIMNMNEKNPFIYNIILDLCSDKEIQRKGGIEASDFISLLDQNLSDDLSSIDDLKKIFSIFSNPDTNTIPLNTFSQINGDRDTSEEEKLKKIISKPEINGKELDFNTFQNIMKSKGLNKNINENIIYIKKNSSNNKQFTYNEDENKDINNNVNNTGINNTNLRDSLESLEKNSEINNNKNNESPKNEEDKDDIEIKYSYKKVKQEKLYINTNIINNQINNNIDINNNDINNFDNININQEKKDEENSNIKKKYRHMRKQKNKDSPQGQNEEESNSKESNNDEVKKEINYSYRNKFTKGRIENKDNNSNNGNEEKNEIKSEKRYHRRYRDVKSSAPDIKDEKKKENNNGENDEKNFIGYSKYRRKK